MESHKTNIRRGRAEIHRDQAIVERFNRTLAERLFGHQYAVEMLLPECQRSSAWVKRLPDVVMALNNVSLVKSQPLQSKRSQSPQNHQQNIPGLLALKKKYTTSCQCEVFVSAQRT